MEMSKESVVDPRLVSFIFTSPGIVIGLGQTSRGLVGVPIWAPVTGLRTSMSTSEAEAVDIPSVSRTIETIAIIAHVFAFNISP